MASNHARPTQNPLVTKLLNFTTFSDDDLQALGSWYSREATFHADADIIANGNTPRSAFVLTAGMACRYRLLAEGRRQIFGFIIPGDICELQAYLLAAMDHSIGTLVPSRIGIIERDRLMNITADHPRIAAALRWNGLQDEAIQRERIVALGRRNARGRVAYLLCELVWRQRAIGLNENHAIRLPLTQLEIADALGLTSVHVNRVLQQFRQEGLIELAHRLLTLLDVRTLQRIAELTREYLHLGGLPPGAERYLNQLERKSHQRRTERPT